MTLSDELIALETEKWEAWKRADYDFFERAFADDYLTVGLPPRGVKTKEETLDEIRSNQLRAEDFALSDFHFVFPTPDTAVITYIARATFAYGEQAFPEATIYATSVLVRREGDWVTVWYQGTAGATH